MGNSNKRNTRLDLHGTRAREVEPKLVSFLLAKKKELRKEKMNRLYCEIITGRGLHSGPEGPVVKPKVEKYLKEKNYRFTIEDANPGKYCVHLGNYSAQNKLPQNKSSQNKLARNKSAQNKLAQNKFARNKSPQNGEPGAEYVLFFLFVFIIIIIWLKFL